MPKPRFRYKARVITKLDRPTFKKFRAYVAGSILQKIGLWIRKVSIRSIKKANDGGGKGKRGERYSRPNKPYKSRDAAGRARRIEYDMNPQHTVGYVGPIKLKRATVPAIHEHGWTVNIKGLEKKGRQTRDRATGRFKKKKLKEVTIRKGYRKRPVMGPAAEKSKGKLAEAWGNVSGSSFRPSP